MAVAGRSCITLSHRLRVGTLGNTVRSQTRIHPRVLSISSKRAATSSGAPAPNFRLPRAGHWDDGRNALDKAGEYFLLTEILRGMYVVLEQFFKPP